MKNQGLKWWHVRWGLASRKIYRFAKVFAKVAGIICLLASLGYGAIYLISPRLNSRGLSKFDTRMNIVPLRLSNKAEAPLSKLSIDLNGFRLILPNNAEDAFKGAHATTVRFPNGVLMVRNSSQDEDWLASELVQINQFENKLFGSDSIHSKYDLMEAAISATPDQVKWWRFRTKENQRIERLLLTKFTALTQITSIRSATVRTIYKIESGGFRGFQFGSSDAPPFDFHADIFDGADRHFQFDVFSSEAHERVLTQSEFNAMVNSILPIQTPTTLHLENIEKH